MAKCRLGFGDGSDDYIRVDGMYRIEIICLIYQFHNSSMKIFLRNKVVHPASPRFPQKIIFNNIL